MSGRACRFDVGRRQVGAVLALAPLLLAAAACSDSGTREPPWEDYLRVVRAEDARPRSGPGLDTLVALTAHAHPLVRAAAVRALGRLEDPGLIPRIAGALGDADGEVRARAAAAIAQTVQGREGTPAFEPLSERIAAESDPEVRGALAEALGRLALPDDGAQQVIRTLLQWTDSAPEPALALGVVRGMEAAMRVPGPAASDPALRLRLHELATYGRDPDFTDPDEATSAARVRATAILALGQRNRLETAAMAAALEDDDPVVRQTGGRFLPSADTADRAALAARAVQDAEPIVRIEGVRALASLDDPDARCASLLAVARDDANDGVRVTALQTLGTACAAAPADSILAFLTSSAGSAPWQLAAAALEALARLAPAAAAAPLGRLSEHPVPFARAAAARIAGTLGDTQTLGRLALDPDPNVRSAALPPLSVLPGAAPDSLLLAQLASDDPQLLITTANLLERSRAPGAAEQALGAFERISTARRETARDARMALLGLVRAQGDPALAERVEPYLADYDPVVAGTAAAMLEAWTGEPHAARPEPLPRLALPTPEDLRSLDRNVVVLAMERGGGRIVIEPLPLIAATNAHRFVRLARSGYFDGLTLHRWAPNFVVQGGSPGANEYSGDAAYTRDEIGHPHWRGTVGLSTRGRDTGDGQIFINLVHNVRLDGDYTIFGRVIEGMDVVDGLLEGDVIATAEVQPGG